MPDLQIVLDGDGAWPDMMGCLEGVLEGVSALPGGMSSGKPSVGLRIRLADGRLLFAQTSMALFVSAARAFVARYGEPV